MSKLVRAIDPTTGAEATYSAAFAKRKGLKVVDKPATDALGRIRRHKPRTDLAGQPVNASMSRDELEAAALSVGIDPDQVAAAKNKGELVAAINHAETTPTAGDAGDDTTEA